ncbi:MAG: hypothetical protein U0W24_19460 [Bacteroidales bacterium]
MRKLGLILVLMVLMVGSSKAQVLFSGAETLKTGAWSIGLNPVYGDRGDGDFAMFFHGGYGIGKNSDLGLKLGFGWSQAYVGLDYERTLLAGKPSVSLFGGAHYWNDFGLDLGSKVTFPIGNVRITSGLDLDINFGEDANNDLEIYAPLWLPISMEIFLKKQVSLVFEGNIKLTSTSFTTVGGGVNIYF